MGESLEWDSFSVSGWRKKDEREEYKNLSWVLV